MNSMSLRRDEYLRTLPDRPYCTNLLGRKLRILDRQRAAGYAMIQHNSPMITHWLVFDIDGDDAFFRAEERGLPPPTFSALNPANGHGHLAYRLESPVSAFKASSRRALNFLCDVERGMTRRLGADWAYSGFLSKNPFSDRWETAWMAVRPYCLETLNDYLEPTDKRHAPASEISAIGRNFTMFENLRKIAYQQWLGFKKAGKSRNEFELMLSAAAEGLNTHCLPPLSNVECRGIVRSVAKWVWNEFSLERFAVIQRSRIQKRWSKVPVLVKTKPWDPLGISRATWYRNRRRNRCQC